MAAMGDDVEAGTVVRSGHGLRYPHDRREPCLSYIQPSPLTRASPTRQARTMPRPWPAPDGWSPAGGAWSRPAAGGGSEPMRPPGITLPEASRSSQIAPTSQSARTILERRSSSLDAHRYRQRPGALLRPGRPALRAAAAHLAGRALTCQARKPEVVEGGDVAGLDGRVAFVTGSARGIGAATAKRLAADGAKLAVVDLEEAACKDTVEAIGSTGGTAIAIGCDVTRPDQVEAAVARTVEELGWLDVLVNNAGLIRDNLLFKMSDDDWGLVIDTH